MRTQSIPRSRLFAGARCGNRSTAFYILFALALQAAAAFAGPGVKEPQTFTSIQASAGAPITGAKAIQHLKDIGQYESLAAAITGARYGAREIADVKVLAQNPAHGIQSTFTPEGLRLEVQAGEVTHKVAWRLASIGYGAAQISVPPGELKVNGQRVEITRGTGPTRHSGVRTPHLVEWFHNTPAGLEHGFTLGERPAANPRGELLRLVLEVRGDLLPQADAAGQNLLLRDAAGQTVMTYEKLKVWDASGAELPATMQVADGKVTLAVKEANAHYPLTIDPTFAQQGYLKASNTGPGDGFGHAVAVTGDTVVVGAPREASSATGVNGDEADNSAQYCGAVYVFVRSGVTWTHQAYLKASNAEIFDKFGSSVSASGDTVVVGAPDEWSNATGVNGDETDNSADRAGAAYVFVRNGTNWTQQAYLKASNTEAYDLFGSSVAVSGDTIVAGAHSEESNASGVNGNQANNSLPNAGAAYIFVRSGTNWTQQAYLKASNPGSHDSLGVYDEFGISVAVSGDTVVVGAWHEASNATGVNGNQADNSALGSGAAYVFVRSGTTWAQQAYLKASNTGGYNPNTGVGAYDNFGYSVAVSGDTVVVGAFGEASNATGIDGNQSDNSAARAGAAYVFFRSGTTWIQQAYLKASNTGADDNFGYSVAVSGDAVVVGALAEGSNATGVDGNESDNSALYSGAAYVFVRSGATWSHPAYFKASNTGAGDTFGAAVAVSGDTVVVGAFGESSNAIGVNGNQTNNSAFGSGAVYIFRPGNPNSDRDGDGLLDSWESEGGGIDVDGDGMIDLDLYALGARPDHKDLFVEIDTVFVTFDDLSSALAEVAIAFSLAPVTNLDGAMGIRLHLQMDETDLPFDNGRIPGFAWPLGFVALKAAHFGTVAQHNPSLSENPNREPILAAKAFAYRYCVIYDRLDFVDRENGYIGLGEIGGNDFVMHFGDALLRDGKDDVDERAGIFMHELGHTLGLRHGGADNIHGKPNYPSIMNYALTIPMTWSKPFRTLDYSREPVPGAGPGGLPTLNETNLVEVSGIPSTLYRDYHMPIGVPTPAGQIVRVAVLDGRPLDFSGNGTFDPLIKADLNYMGTNAFFPGVDAPSPGQLLPAQNDWANLLYKVNPDNTEAGAAVTLSEGCPSRKVLQFLEENVPIGADTFAGWINHFDGVGAQTGFSDDPDGDGIPNGIERFLGTSPSARSTGLVFGGATLAAGFRHSRSVEPPTNTVAVYHWSTDLIDWHASGETADGITVTLSPGTIEKRSLTDTIHIIPSITGSTSKLFFRLRVQTGGVPAGMGERRAIQQQSPKNGDVK